MINIVTSSEAKERIFELLNELLDENEAAMDELPHELLETHYDIFNSFNSERLITKNFINEIRTSIQSIDEKI